MSFISPNVNDSAYENRFANIKEHILLQLGWPLIRVELTDQHLMLAIIDAITLYYKYAGTYYACVLCNVDSLSQITIPDNINKKHVYDVIFPYQVMDSILRGFGTTGIGDETGIYVLTMKFYNQMLNNFDMVTYYKYLQQLEDFRKLVGIERHWDIVGDKKIQLYPSGEDYGKVGLMYKLMETDDELENERWIYNWATAKAKHMLGIVRAKFSTFTAGGSNVGSDADSLKSEAKEEMTALKEELMKMQRPLPIIQI